MHIVIGAYGWLHEQWKQSYYPDDIPVEWCLNYYANEFNTVLVPFGLWSLNDHQEIQSWADDLPENFQLFFEVESDSGIESVKNVLPSNLRLSHQVVFSPITYNKIHSYYNVQEGVLVSKAPDDKTVMLLRISIDDAIKIGEIKDILDKVQDDYRQYETVYLFFDGALLEMSTLNTAAIIVDLLATSK